MTEHLFPPRIRQLFIAYGRERLIEASQDPRLHAFLRDNDLPAGDSYVMIWDDGAETVVESEGKADALGPDIVSINHKRLLN